MVSPLSFRADIYHSGMLTLASQEILMPPMWPGGPTSAVHNTDDLEWTVDAFGRSLRTLKDEGDVQSKAWVEASSGE